MLGVDDVEPLLHLPFLLADRSHIFTFPVDHKQIAGCAAIVDDGPFIFVARAGELEALFQCAHELAYLILMSVKKSDAAAFDAPVAVTTMAKSPYEHFADAFALELLVPTRGLGLALGEIRRLLKAKGSQLGDVDLLYLSRIFGISFLAMAKRCEREDLLPKGGALSLHEFLVTKFGGPERRAEESDLPPRPIVRFPNVPRVLELASLERIQRRQYQSSSATHYAKITPTKLAKSYADAGHFERNIRRVEVLIDQDAARTGLAAKGEPWKFYDLGHGYCAYDFFEQCPHRLAEIAISFSDIDGYVRYSH